MTIETIDKPAGYDGQYRFFRNTETGRCWKVKVELREVRPALVDSPVDVATGEFGVTVTVSPPGEDGKALLEDGKPIVIDSHTHTFTATEMSEEGFDPQNRIMLIVEERIALGEARMTAADKLRALTAGWA